MAQGKATATVLALFTAMLLSSPAGAAEYKHVEDFESGEMSFGSFYRDSGNPPVVTGEVARVGSYAMKSYLNRLESSVSYRTELTFNNGDQKFEEHWFGFSIYIPESYVESDIWEILAQWHDKPVSWEVGRQNPPLFLEIKDGQWSLTNIWDADRVAPDGSFKIDGRKNWKFGPFERGKWVDWVVHVKWSYKSDGYLQVWKDGKKVVDTTGPNAYNDDVAPYMKLGVYKGWKNRTEPADRVHERTVFHDEIRIAGPGGTYDDVAPGGGRTIPEAPVLTIN